MTQGKGHGFIPEFNVLIKGMEGKSLHWYICHVEQRCDPIKHKHRGTQLPPWAGQSSSDNCWLGWDLRIRGWKWCFSLPGCYFQMSRKCPDNTRIHIWVDFVLFLSIYILIHCAILHLIGDFSPTASGSLWKVNWTLQVHCALMSRTSGKYLACRLQPPLYFLCKTSYQKQCLWFFKINILSVSVQFYNSEMPFSQTGQPSVWRTRKTIYLLSASLFGRGGNYFHKQWWIDTDGLITWTDLIQIPSSTFLWITSA